MVKHLVGVIFAITDEKDADCLYTELSKRVDDIQFKEGDFGIVRAYKYKERDEK